MNISKIANCLVVLSILSISVFASAVSVSGTVMVAKGKVQIKNKSGTTDAKVGSKVQEGDTIVTAVDSRAKIVMADRNVINVNPETEIQIESYQNDPATGTKNVQMNLLSGKVRNNVEQTYDGEKSKFLIKTPTAVAGVRGTQFLTGFNRITGLTSVIAFKGAVQLFAISTAGAVIGAPVLIKKGQMSQVTTDATPEPPMFVPPQEMRQMDGDSMASMKGPGPNGPPDRGLASDGSGPNPNPSPNQQLPPPPSQMSMMTMQDMDMGMVNQIKEVREVLLPPPPPVVINAPGIDPSIVNEIIRDTVSKTRLIVVPQIQ